MQLQQLRQETLVISIVGNSGKASPFFYTLLRQHLNNVNSEICMHKKHNKYK